MDTSLSSSDVDERASSAGTTVRFVLLVALILVTSGLMVMLVAVSLSDYDITGCALAAGVDPSQATDQALLVARTTQWKAWDACESRYAVPPPLWIPLLAPVVLVALATALFFLLPTWKQRRGGLVPLEPVDRDGEILRVLSGLAATAGLARVPRIVVDPARASTGAVVFGRDGRPTVSLHGGLLVRRRTDPEGFKAVVLHEFAHIRNRDVTLAYGTIALWHAFLLVCLPPFLAMCVSAVSLAGLDGDPVASHGLALTAVLLVLVYLARSDVLRSRELYADVAAVRWGADARVWESTAPPLARHPLRRLFSSFVELWRVHPRGDVRRRSLTDPGVRSGVQGLPMFLTGTAASLVNFQLWTAQAYYTRSATAVWVPQALTLVPAALVAGVVGITLWRAVVHAQLTGRRVPTGLRSGLLLGSGLAVGAVVAGQGSINQLLPGQALTLVLYVVGAPAFTWWISQCARLWARNWRGRTLRPVLLLSLVAACLALATWLTWWQGGGAVITTGWWYDHEGTRAGLEHSYPGDVGGYEATLSAAALLSPVLATLGSPPLGVAAVALLWLVPLLAWMVRPTAATELPPLRRVLLPGLWCGTLFWAVALGVQAYLGAERSEPVARYSFPSLVLLSWLVVSLVVMMLAAAIAGALASRNRLLTALITTQVATLVGLGGLLVTLSLDGCASPFNFFESTCGVRSEVFQWPDLLVLLSTAPALGAIVALLVAGVVSVSRWVRPSWTRLPRAVRQSGTPRTPRTRLAWARGSGARPGTLTRRRLWAGGLYVIALAYAGVATVQHVERTVLAGDPARLQAHARTVTPTADAVEVSARSRALQMDAWSAFGGRALLNDLSSNRKHIETVVRTAQSRNDPAYVARVRPYCQDVAAIASESGDYFLVPDPAAQQLWESFVPHTWESSQLCLRGVEKLDSGQTNAAFTDLSKSFAQLANVDRLADTIRSRVTRLKRAGGM